MLSNKLNANKNNRHGNRNSANPRFAKTQFRPAVLGDPRFGRGIRLVQLRDQLFNLGDFIHYDR